MSRCERVANGDRRRRRRILLAKAEPQIQPESGLSKKYLPDGQGEAREVSLGLTGRNRRTVKEESVAV
jgi:hypothetical protein